MDAVETTAAMDSSRETHGRLLREVRNRLRSAGYHAHRDIQCDCQGGVAVLRGRVPTYYLKQVAQSALLRHPGDIKVVNLIEVVPDRNEALTIA